MEYIVYKSKNSNFNLDSVIIEYNKTYLNQIFSEETFKNSSNFMIKNNKKLLLVGLQELYNLIKNDLSNKIEAIELFKKYVTVTKAELILENTNTEELIDIIKCFNIVYCNMSIAGIETKSFLIEENKLKLNNNIADIEAIYQIV